MKNYSKYCLYIAAERNGTPRPSSTFYGKQQIELFSVTSPPRLYSTTSQPMLMSSPRQYSSTYNIIATFFTQVIKIKSGSFILPTCAYLSLTLYRYWLRVGAAWEETTRTRSISWASRRSLSGRVHQLGEQAQFVR